MNRLGAILIALLALTAVPARAQGIGGTPSVLSATTELLNVNGPINQSQTLTGTPSEISANDLFINDAGAQFGTGFGQGWAFQENFGGSTSTGGRNVFTTWAYFDAATASGNTNRNYASLVPMVTAAAPDGGVFGTPKGAFFAMNPVAIACGGSGDTADLCPGTAGSAATYITELTGAEFDFAAHTGSSPNYKAGVTVTARGTDQVHGASVDAGYVLSAAAGAIGLNNGFLFTDQNGTFPVDSAGALMGAFAGSAVTLANGIDLSNSNLTFSGCAFKSKGFCLDGPGSISLSGAPAVVYSWAGVNTNVGVLQTFSAAQATTPEIGRVSVINATAGGGNPTAYFKMNEGNVCTTESGSASCWNINNVVTLQAGSGGVGGIATENDLINQDQDFLSPSDNPLAAGFYATGALTNQYYSDCAFCATGAGPQWTYGFLGSQFAPAGGVVTFSGSTISRTAHGFVAGQALNFKTTGTLPSPLALVTRYYVLPTGLTANNFEVSATPGGSAASLSGGSGTLSAVGAPVFQAAMIGDFTNAPISYDDESAHNIGFKFNGTYTTALFQVNGTNGVSCPSGINPVTYQSVLGIVTHC